jgi:RimJ/RimL family protein N-acetyltransferase
MMVGRQGSVLERRRRLRIREICPEDYEDYLRLLNQLNEESPYLLFPCGDAEPGKIGDGNRHVFVAETDGKLTGHVVIRRGDDPHNRHIARPETGVLKKYQNQRVGTRLLEKAIQWAQEQDIKRLEISILRPNLKAIYFYKKMGFQIEGMRNKSLFIQDRYADEYYMARLLFSDETKMT